MAKLGIDGISIRQMEKEESPGSTILIEIKFHNRWNQGSIPMICLVRFLKLKKAHVNRSKRPFYRHIHRDYKHQEPLASGILSKKQFEPLSEPHGEILNGGQSPTGIRRKTPEKSIASVFRKSRSMTVPIIYIHSLIQYNDIDYIIQYNKLVSF